MFFKDIYLVVVSLKELYEVIDLTLAFLFFLAHSLYYE